MDTIGNKLESHAADKNVRRIERVNIKQIPAIEKLVINGTINRITSDKITSFIVNFRSLAFGAVYLNQRASSIDVEHTGRGRARSVVDSQ